jgi:hypothetical protein
MHFNYGGTMPNPKEVVVQTRVTAAQYQIIESAAQNQGVSVAAFVRAATMRFATVPLINAWSTDAGENPATVLAYGRLPQYLLQRIADGASGEQTYAMYVLTEHGPMPVPRSAVAYEMPFLRDPWRHQFVLEGSHSPWVIVRSMFNTGTGLVEIVLRLEGTATDVVRRRIRHANGGPLTFDLIGGAQLVGRADLFRMAADSFELAVEGQPMRTVPYANVVAVGNAP